MSDKDTDHAEEVLRVYRSRTLDGGFWSPVYGDLRGPKEWEFLAAGDAYLTRTVKRRGPHWLVLKPGKGYTRTVGVLAPSASVDEASKLAKATEARRLNTKNGRGSRGNDRSVATSSVLPRPSSSISASHPAMLTWPSRLPQP